MQLTRIICLLFILTLVGCKSKYVTKEFKYAEAPKSPDYNKLNSWAAHPDKNDTIIDKFYNDEKKNLKADGLLSTCIQHEIDHLDGVLFVDYLSKLKKDMIIKKLKKYKKEVDKVII